MRCPTKALFFSISLSFLLTLSVFAGSNGVIVSADRAGAIGVVATSSEVFVTTDGGSTFEAAKVELGLTESIAAVCADGGGRLLTSSVAGIFIVRISDGVRSQVIAPERFTTPMALNCDGGSMTVEVAAETSSNFHIRAFVVSTDGGTTWHTTRISEDRPADNNFANIARELDLSTNESVVSSKNDWHLTQRGECFGFKTGCVQETRLFGDNDREITPQQVKTLAIEARDTARRNASSHFAAPPGGNTRISLNRGFDKCQAGSVSQMLTWWNNSPHFDSNIYFSGRNRACPSQPLNTTWVDQVTAQGWGLIPTVVGYQSPCTVSATSAKLSYDVPTAETQGRGEADIAAADAAAIGLTAGSILYYDMERYDPPTPDTLGCRPATVAFLKGWTERIRELGYKSGVYGSPKNAIEDWQFMPPVSKMDAVWMARWDNVMTVWTYVSFPTFPATEWANHQRIKQWQAPHNETWGGVTFNIDGNISDAPVAGLTVARNRTADFDGDQKADLSIFRPSLGVWFIQNSATPTFTVVGFGNATDILAPGDYDGDGKTDLGVFRASEGVWYLYGKGNTFTTRPFGAAGDIPAPADYNGDGKTDIAVFRPSTATWYIANSDSQGTTSIIGFGTNGDVPIKGDFDGDSKDDIAIYRPNGATGGEWWIRRSSNESVFATQFGSSTDKAVAGDYTGDGKADVAFWRPSTGFWYILRSEDLSYYALPFGTATDLPVPADYDGDGRYDVGVFRPTDGTWYIQRSTAGIFIQQFGQNGDIPIANAFVR